jgi:hypothetical protein
MMFFIDLHAFLSMATIMHIRGLYNLITNQTQYKEVCLACPFISLTLAIDSDYDGTSYQQVQRRLSRYGYTNID